MNKLNNFLKTKKGRLIFLGIPVLLCVAGLSLIYIHALYNFSFIIPSGIRIFGIIVSIITLINLGIIIWLDNKEETEVDIIDNELK